MINHNSYLKTEVGRTWSRKLNLAMSVGAEHGGTLVRTSTGWLSSRRRNLKARHVRIDLTRAAHRAQAQRAQYISVAASEMVHLGRTDRVGRLRMSHRISAEIVTFPVKFVTIAVATTGARV